MNSIAHTNNNAHNSTTFLQTKKGAPKKLPNEKNIVQNLMSYAKSLLNSNEMNILEATYGNIWNAVELATFRRGINIFVKTINKNTNNMTDQQKIQLLAQRNMHPTQMRCENTKTIITVQTSMLYFILDDIFRTTVNIMNRWPLLDHCANINQTYMSILNAQGNNIDDWDKFEALFMSAAIGFKLAIAYQVKFVRSGEIDGSIQSSTKTRTNEEAIIDLKNISEGFSSVLEYAKDICTTRTAKRIKEMIRDDETDILKKQATETEIATYLAEIENDIERIAKKVETAMDKIVEEDKKKRRAGGKP